MLAVYVAWRLDREPPSIVEPLSARAFKSSSGQYFVHTCVSVKRGRSCPFVIDRAAWVDGVRHRLPSESRPALPVETIPRTCRDVPLPPDGAFRSGAEVTLRYRMAYECNPLHWSDPIATEVAFDPVRLP
jgi:hypothetical protein